MPNNRSLGSTQLVCPKVDLQRAAVAMVDGICDGSATIYFPSYLSFLPVIRGLFSTTTFHWTCAVLGLSGGHNFLSINHT